MPNGNYYAESQIDKAFALLQTRIQTDAAKRHLNRKADIDYGLKQMSLTGILHPSIPKCSLPQQVEECPSNQIKLHLSLNAKRTRTITHQVS